MLRTRIIRKRMLAILPLVALVLALPLPAFAADPEPMHVKAGEHVQGDVATTTQDIVVDGAVDGDVTSWSGSITVNGDVTGDVVTYTGNIEVGANAHIDGSVMSIGGAVSRDSSAEIQHAALGRSQATPALASLFGIIMTDNTAPPTDAEVAGRIVLGVLAAIFLLAFAVLWCALWPNRTLATAMTLRKLPFRAIATGLFATVLVLLLGPPLVGLLAASMIGIPILAALVAAINIPYLYGLAAVARAFGGSTTDSSLAPLPARQVIATAAACAIVIGIVAAIAPVNGLIVFYLLASPGLGAVLLSRGGMAVPRSFLHS